MTNLQTLNERYELLSRLVKMYRKELVDFQGDIVESTGECTKEDYVQFMNGLSDDAFTGNIMNTILYDYGFNDIRKLLDDEITIDDYVNMLRAQIWWL